MHRACGVHVSEVHLHRPTGVSQQERREIRADANVHLPVRVGASVEHIHRLALAVLGKQFDVVGFACDDARLVASGF